MGAAVPGWAAGVPTAEDHWRAIKDMSEEPNRIHGWEAPLRNPSEAAINVSTSNSGSPDASTTSRRVLTGISCIEPRDRLRETRRSTRVWQPGNVGVAENLLVDEDDRMEVDEVPEQGFANDVEMAEDHHNVPVDEDDRMEVDEVPEQSFANDVEMDEEDDNGEDQEVWNAPADRDGNNDAGMRLSVSVQATRANVTVDFEIIF